MVLSRAIIAGVSAFFTRKGDDGTTGLLGEGRVPKHHPRPEAYGTVDEASSALGLARAAVRSAEVREVIKAAQRDLYLLMAELAAPPPHAEKFHKIDTGRVQWLETQVERFGGQVDMPNDFIVPGDSPAGAALDLARTVVRRAERCVARLLDEGLVENRDLLRYLNRLSSLCFALELFENRLAGSDRPTMAKGSADQGREA
jgi:cob(I)alamin adenosyltransferase